MPIRSTRTLLRSVVVASLLCLTASAWSADPAPASSDPGLVPSKEQREQMAVLHERMAACLRSDKSVTECRSDMMRGCQQTLGASGCRWMGWGHRMGGGRRMVPPTPPPAPPTNPTP